MAGFFGGENGRRRWDVSSAGLHLIAMGTMLIDHGMKTVVENDSWVFALGRLAFPIFAFMVAEGCVYTSNFRKYMLRMLGFALVSEIPYDLMKSGVAVDWYDQNVIWTFLLALICVRGIQMLERVEKRWVFVLGTIGVFLVGFLAGTYSLVDYGGMGIWTVLIFYLLRERKWWMMVLQAVLLFFINVFALGGLGFAVSIIIFGMEMEVPIQGFAVMAFIPIWLYHGRQGYHSKAFQYLCYAFYPVHMLILALLAMALK